MFTVPTRRDLLLTAAAAALLPGVPGFAEPAAESHDVKVLHSLFDRFFKDELHREPTLATSLGLDVGTLAPLKSQLGDRSLAAVARESSATAQRLRILQQEVDRTKLTGLDGVSYDTVLFTLQVEDEGNRRFAYGGGDLGSPYVLSQLTGAYQSVPDFLDTQHRIETKRDADYYLERLDAFARVMDEELEVARHDAGLGVVPPDFIIDKALIQMQAFLDTPSDKAIVVRSLARRTAEKGIAGDWEAQAASRYTAKILPALARQAAHLKELRGHAVHDAGIGRLPQGADYYRLSLKHYTTSTLSPDEIHKTGLDLVTSLSAEIDTLLKAAGKTEGSVGRRLAALVADPQYLYANTDEAKDQLIADLNAKVTTVQAKLPAWFGTLPKAGVEIRRVPKAIEAGAPGGYYQPGSLDGSRKGAYYINLRDTAEVPRWTLPTLTFHESIPGHHLQGTLAHEMTDLPLIRKVMWFSGYGEGWALYAEQLAVEMGLYEGDPLGRIGQLQGALFRAVRLVVDSGMHHKGWSREQAIAYFVDTLGDKETVATTEVERYCVWPGQACSYMLGKLTWLRLREQARHGLGDRFDIRKFHDAGLLSGAVPLAVLDQVIGAYIKTA